jgi:hypothetical protein
MENNKSQQYLRDALELLVWEDTQVEQKDREFGDGMDDGVEDLRDIVQLLLYETMVPTCRSGYIPGGGGICFPVGCYKSVFQSLLSRLKAIVRTPPLKC